MARSPVTVIVPLRISEADNAAWAAAARTAGCAVAEFVRRATRRESEREQRRAERAAREAALVAARQRVTNRVAQMTKEA